MKTSQNIGFEILKKDDDVIVLKRVLPLKKGKRRENIEMTLPKLSVHYFSIREIEHLQQIALDLSERKTSQRVKRTIKSKIISFFKLTDSIFLK